MGNRKTLATLFLILAFCSFGYQLLLLFTIPLTTSNDFLSQTLTVGVFILGLGVGAWLGSKIKATQVWWTFVIGEIFLALVGGFSPLLFLSHHALSMMFSLDTPHSWLITSQFLTLVIATLSGLELPLIHRLHRQKFGESVLHVYVGYTYLGAFFAAILIPYFVLPKLGTSQTALSLGFLNLISTFALVTQTQLPWRRLALPLAITLLLMLSFWRLSPSFENWLVRYSYTPVILDSLSQQQRTNLLRLVESAPKVERIHSRYQTIDLVTNHSTENFMLFLNQRLQFNQRTQIFYHEAMAHVPQASFKIEFKNILVLGGGDGLLAKELLRHPEVERIQLVELDPKMIELANSHSSFTKLNELALMNTKVKVHIHDAYNFIRESHELFDAIYLDLPYPDTHELSRLYSREFYQFILKRLKPSGFACLDFPVLNPTKSNIFPRDILINTLLAAGATNLIAFGRNDAFVAFGQKRPNLKEAFTSSLLSTHSQEKLRDYSHLLINPKIDSALVNSVFRPLRFQINEWAAE